MEYLLSFIEGIITFISPCMLPMLPIYVSYFAGNNTDEKEKRHGAVINSLGFVIGLSVVFILLGVAAASFGRFFRENSMVFNIIGGLFLILFGINYIGLLKLDFLNKVTKINIKIKSFHFLSAVLFGMIFAIGWTPCTGAFLSSALLLAANSNESIKGFTLLLLYSLGLGIPFIISALLLDSLKKTFDFIKRHYKVINTVSGILLIVIGLLMMFGRLNLFLSILTF